MSSAARELYQQVILDHNKNPRNCRVMADPSHHAEGHNPLCGDVIDVYLDLKDGVIADISFQGSGCAISQSSASIMTTMLKGKTPEEAERLFDQFRSMVTGDTDTAQETEETVGKLAVFSGVREFPARVKCASLAWHTVTAALRASDAAVSTE
ncbi:MAG: Fe-S cluster assembly sulfur transfer protein SufU [Capsulimonadaceae bacterium]